MKYRKRNFYLFFPFLTFIFIYKASFSQNIPSPQPKVIPPSPEAQAFQRYGEYPVDYSTGVPKIDIPLYEIHSGKLSLPVTLSYHASGMRINDIATNVGLGWTLLAGGMVSRAVKGIPDEIGPYGYLSMAHKTKADIDNATQDGNLFQYLNLVKLGTYDAQSDNYFYSAGEKLSGQFIYDMNNTIQPLSYTKNQIKPDFTNNTFEIIGDDGTDYLFTQPEIQTATGINGNYTSSWLLTQMISYDKADTIKFEYNSIVTGDYDTFLSFSQEYGTGAVHPSPFNPGWTNLNVSRTSVIYNNTVLLTKISFKNGSVQFNYQDGRLDRRKYQLNSVSINAINADNSISLLKEYTFNYGYFNSGGSDSYNNRLRLDKINLLDKSLLTVGKYSFIYNMQTRLPAYFNPNDQSYIIGSNQGWLSMDYYGYYNGASNTNTIPTLPPYGSANYNGFAPADRKPNEIYAQANMLQQIVYPTGGTTDFAFESNKDLAGNLIGGLRIKTITSKADAAAIPVIKKYTYGDPITLSLIGLQSAYQFNEDNIIYAYHTNINQCTTQPCNRTMYFGSYPWPLSEHNGSPIIYNLVQEYTDGGNVPSLRTDYLYDIETDRQYNVDCPQVNNTYFANRSWARGNLTNTIYYKYLNGAYKKLRTTDRIYTPFKTGTINSGLKVFDEILIEGDCADAYVYNYTTARGYFYYFDDLADFGIKKISSETNTEYDDNENPTATQINLYQYGSSSHLYPTQETSTDSKGVTTTKTTKYVTDLIQSGTAETARQQLIALNNIAPVLQETQQKGNSIVTTSNTYDVFNNYPYPYTSTRQYGSGPVLNEYTFSGYNNGKLSGFQNLNGPLISYQWGYRQQYPVAEIKNASNTLKTTVTPGGNGFSVQFPSTNRDVATRQFTVGGDGTASLSIDFGGDEGSGTVRAELTIAITGPNNYGTGSFSLCLATGTATCGNYSSSRVLTGLAPGNYTLTASIYDAQNLIIPINLSVTYSASITTVSGYRDFYYENFEEGAGNSAFNDCRTGHLSYTGAYSKALSGLSSKSYILSYWLKTGNSWTLQMLPPVSVTGGTYTISIPSGQIDDVRFYPSDAQMTTYTYDPLVGMTSMTDPKNETTTYEYDSLQRLKIVRDKDGNIVKQTNYHYQGQ
ncbi:hypothetical protein [Mucilaginibacter sp. NFX135]|uniref:hypothetical protein n=1 Tax=Mucilaginibacter sp. NFX135 TaxID=3402687 RepID=UPI003AFA7FEE